MARFTEIRADGRQVEPLARTVEIRSDHADLGGDAGGTMAVLRRVLIVAGALVEEAEHGNARANHIHGIRRLRNGLDEIDDPLRQLAQAGEFLLQGVEFGLVRQMPGPEKVDDFFVGDLPGEFVDVVTGVDEHPFRATHITEGGGVCDDSFESFGDNGHMLFTFEGGPVAV